jgi:hypothetical protein
MSRRGWGPKVYGFFPGGQLEEYFVGSHTLTAKEAWDVVVRCAVAKSYARLHSLQLPLRRDCGKLVVREFVKSVQRKRGESRGEYTCRSQRGSVTRNSHDLPFEYQWSWSHILVASTLMQLSMG